MRVVRDSALRTPYLERRLNEVVVLLATEGVAWGFPYQFRKLPRTCSSGRSERRGGRRAETWSGTALPPMLAFWLVRPVRIWSGLGVGGWTSLGPVRGRKMLIGVWKQLVPVPV